MASRMLTYIRVSTDKQTVEGFSLEGQRRQTRAYVEAFPGMAFAGECVDAGESARTMKRPGLAYALATLDRGEADGLIVTKLDRLTRSVRDLTWLLDRYFTSRFALVSMGENLDTRTATGRLMVHLIGMFAEWESEKISERTREGMREAKAQGSTFGPKPAVDGVSLARMRSMREAGASLRGIAEALAIEGYKPPGGRRWSPETVRRTLARQ